MRLTEKIAGDIRAFVAPVNIQSSLGILRIWVIVLGKNNAQFFLVQDKSLDFIGCAVGLKTTNDEREELSDFLPKLALWLHETLEENAFERVLLVAQEPLLSATQRMLSHSVACRVLAVVKKDFSGFCFDDLQRELVQIVWP